MALVTDILMQGFSGRTGDFVYVRRNGKTFVYHRPKRKTKIGQSEQAKLNRAKFGAAAKFTKVVNGSNELNRIWTDTKLDGSLAFNRIMKYNIKQSGMGEITNKNVITPKGLKLKLNLLIIEENKIKTEFSIPDYKNLIFPAFIFFLFCFDKDTILLQTEGLEKPAGKFAVNYELIYPVKRAMIENSNPLVLMAVSGIPNKKKKFYWTSTAAKQVPAQATLETSP